MHALQPMQRSGSKSTMPSSRRNSAVTGHTATHGASSHWLHRMHREVPARVRERPLLDVLHPGAEARRARRRAPACRRRCTRGSRCTCAGRGRTPCGSCRPPPAALRGAPSPTPPRSGPRHAATDADDSSGRPSLPHVPTPPSTTWMTSRAPGARSRLARGRRPLPGGADHRDGRRRVDALRASPSMSCYGVNARPGMCPASHSLRSRTSRICSGGSFVRALRAARGPSCAGMRSTRRCSSRQLVIPPCEVAARAGHADASGEPDPRGAPSSSSRPMKTISCVAVGEPRQLRAEARAQHRDADRARDVRVVELLIGADVDEQRAVAPACCSTWRGASGSAATPSVSSGPRVDARRSRWKFGGCGPSPASAPPRTRPRR